SQYIPPWSEPYIIGVAGCSGSGKTSVASKIIQEINQPWTILLSLDNFYKPVKGKDRERVFKNEYDFDDPSSLDLDLLFECVKSLKEGKKTEIPIYSFTHHDRTDKTVTIYGANVIIVEGIYALYNRQLLELMDTKIFVDTDLDICLARRLNRDIASRGRDLEGILKQWNAFVKPNSVKYVRPTIDSADLVIPRGADNHVGINMMINHISKQLSKKSKEHLKHLSKLGKIFRPLDDARAIRLPRTNQLNCINTILLNKSTRRDEFIFYFDRIATILLTHALNLLTYTPVKITTPTNYEVKSIRPLESIVAINMIRSGDCFMNSIKRTLPDVTIGKLLIQSDSLTGEPQLHTESLPPSIYDNHVKILLFDAQIISGAAAIMAIQVLLDHGLRQQDIVLVGYLCTEMGMRRILNAFSEVKIIVGLMSQQDIKTYNEINRNVTEENYDSDWWFKTRFVDNVYFGT
ncbi:hypothetical protein PACTADRAFT_19390, partial [Pachysolen tannophilus NRRL Y-2460]